MRDFRTISRKSAVIINTVSEGSACKFRPSYGQSIDLS
jgi:hypothetical protein